MTKVERLKVVWTEGLQDWHHEFDLTTQPTNVNGLMVVHVSDKSMAALITAAREEGAREERERLAPFVQAVLDSFQKPLGNMTGPMNALEKAIRAGEGEG